MSVDPRFYDEILPILWRGGEWGYYWSNDDLEGNKVTLWHRLSDNPAPKVPGIWQRRMNCYFGIHPTKQRGESSWLRAKLADIALINCIYAEVDGIDTPESEANWSEWLLNDCPVRPSLIVWSGGGLHVYWLLDAPFLLDTPENFERATVANKAMVLQIGGDTSVHDLARVLRIPGTINHKPERNGATVDIRYWEPDETYTLEKIEAAIPDHIANVRQARQVAHTVTAQFESLGMDDQNVLRVLFGAGKNGELYRQLWEGDLSGLRRQDHSIADLTLCDGLAWATGCDKEQMDRLFRQSGLMRPKWDSRPDYRESTLTKAINTTQSVYDPTKGRDMEAIAAAEAAVNAPQSNGSVSPDPDPQPTPKPPPQNGSAPVPPPPQAKAASSTYPYFVDKGRIYVEGEDSKGNAWEKVVADFTASITQEITTESGERIFEIAGAGKRGGKYTVQIPAETIGKSRELVAIIEGAVGALDTVRANMSAHLGPAIKLLSQDTQLKRIKRFQRTGWSGKHFMVPGREPAATEIQLHQKLVYNLGSQADEQAALDALAAFMETPGTERSTVMLSHVLTPPLAKLADWDDERYILMVRGTSGTFKTSVTQVLMCIYGANFRKDTNLIKLGEGITRNALMAIATQACDIPLFIDNYKPNTDTANGFVTLIHNILEGGEKERLNRNAQLKETKPLQCWPLITGEDVPETDPAALARILIIQFDETVRSNSNILSTAQRLSPHLPYIGASWINWLETDAKDVIDEIAEGFQATRSRWADLLYALQPAMVNPMRVATNLSINELAYKIACRHPVFGPILAPYLPQHLSGLMSIANAMAISTVETAEYQRFIASIRDLVASGAAMLPDKGVNVATVDRGRVVGWRETDGSVYLLPKIAMAFAERNIGMKFNSSTQIGLQLEERGYLQSRDKDKRTRKLRMGNDTVNVLHITKAGFEL